MVQIFLSSFKEGRKRSNNAQCICWYPTQINQFDITLAGWKKYSKAVRCQRLAEHISGYLLATAETHQAEPHQPLGHRHIHPMNPRAIDCMYSSVLKTSSTVLLPMIALVSASGVCLSVPSWVAWQEGAGLPSLLLTVLLQCYMSEQEPYDNNRPREAKPQDPLSAL